MEWNRCNLHLILLKCTFLGVILSTGVHSLCINVKKLDLCRETTLSMPSKYGNCGAEVQAHWAHNMPNVRFLQARTSAKYLLLMVDPDAPNAENPTMAYWRHWVVADIPGSALLHGDLSGAGNTLTDYAPPSPPPGSGPHRYQLLLFKEEEPLGAMETAQVGNESRGQFDVDSFLESLGLCREDLVASYQYLVRN